MNILRDINKAIFLDRDGTINVEKNYLHRIQDFEFLPDVIEALKLFQKNNFMLIIITNQSGIARGYYTEKEYLRLNAWLMDELLNHYHVQIAASYYCPHLPNASISEYSRDCTCRKPKTGLFDKAIQELNIQPEYSYAIGDKIRDISPCYEKVCGFEGMRGYLIGDNEDDTCIQDIKNGYVSHVLWKKDLWEAAKDICGIH